MSRSSIFAGIALVFGGILAAAISYTYDGRDNHELSEIEQLAASLNIILKIVWQ